jgi:hypothetical protein
MSTAFTTHLKIAKRFAIEAENPTFEPAATISWTGIGADELRRWW